MPATWIVSANAARARIFSRTTRTGPLEEVSDLVNTAARLRTSEMETDELGQRSASKSRHSVGQATTPSGYQPAQSPAEHQTELFARDVAQYLERAHQEGRFGELVLVASPEFLGQLRKLIPARLGATLGAEIDKDYTRFGPEELRERIEAHGGRH